MSDYDSKVIREYLKVRGSVQGVGFRYRAKFAAEMVGVSGWVRNDPDGAVSMEIQGTQEQIDRVIHTVNGGSYVQIEDVQVREIPLADDDRGFRVRGY